MSDLAYYFIQLFRETHFPRGADSSEESNAFFEYGNDILLAYRGDSGVLFHAMKAYWATNNSGYAHAGAANILGRAAYIGGGQGYVKKGLEEAFHLLENAKRFAPDNYHVESIEIHINILYKDMQRAEWGLKNLRRFPEALNHSNHARLQMSYWEVNKNMAKVRQWYEHGLKLVENDVRRVSLISLMASIVLHQEGYSDEAISLYRQVVQLDPNDPWAWHNLSIIYLNRKEYEKAGECNRMALDLMPFGSAEAIIDNLLAIWEKTRHKDPLKEYPRYLSSSVSRGERNNPLGGLLSGKK